MNGISQPIAGENHNLKKLLNQLFEKFPKHIPIKFLKKIQKHCLKIFQTNF